MTPPPPAGKAGQGCGSSRTKAASSWLKRDGSSHQGVSSFTGRVSYCFMEGCSVRYLGFARRQTENGVPLSLSPSHVQPGDVVFAVTLCLALILTLAAVLMALRPAIRSQELGGRARTTPERLMVVGAGLLVVIATAMAVYVPIKMLVSGTS